MDGVAPDREIIPYDPKAPRARPFRDHVQAFLDGSDTPRAYLERCLEAIAARETRVRAFVAMNIEGARKAADASTGRYKAGRPLSVIDGMPFAVKDTYETVDMPTECGTPIFEGWQPMRDAAHAYAMRRGGAAILAKASTTEFAMADPPATRNPYDTGRTAGGSSSGSAASVGAGFVPAASGSQARGSIVRPAGYCGAYALKPSLGAINRLGGDLMVTGHMVVGVIGATLRDVWETAYYMSDTIGGDAGFPGLYGTPDLPAPVKPDRVVRLFTAGWDVTADDAKEAFERFVTELGKDVQVISRYDDPRIEALEHALLEIPEYLFKIIGYEMRWPAWNYQELYPGKFSETILGYLAAGKDLRPDEYREALRRRDALRAHFAAVERIAPVCIAPAQPDAAPVGMGIGDPVYGDVTSILGTPAVVLPVMVVQEMPFAVQVMGQRDRDWELMRHSLWLRDWALARR